jgi:uncharacterized protein
MVKQNAYPREAASSRGLFVNSGNGPTLQPIDIGHKAYVGLIDPDTAFWSLVRKDQLADVISGGDLMAEYRNKAADFAHEMEMLRFHLKPSAVYFNPTERCNLNCTYCYIPEGMRKGGIHMSEEEVLAALERLHAYFEKTMPEGRLPQIIFHGAEPMLNRKAVFAGIEAFEDRFRFGIQTNATLLDDEAIAFLTSHGVGIGLSLDGPIAEIADLTRTTWGGNGTFDAVTQAMDKLRGYDGYNVICTVTRENVQQLRSIVEFFHENEVPACMLNVIRCTLPGARTIRAEDSEVVPHFLAALDRSYQLYQQSGRKLIIANFANVLISILAPTARRLMCDISPCGGGRSFFALAPNGDLFPCSEFIGLPTFNGGNLFRNTIDEVLESEAFRQVTERKVEDINPCQRCVIRHFCGSPCPAEAYEMNGSMEQTGAYCEFYEEQVRYAFRLIAEGKEDAFLWDGWDEGTETTFIAPGKDACMA